MPRHRCPRAPPGPAIPTPNQPELRSNPRRTRDFLAALWPPDVVSTIVVYGFLFLTDVMDTDEKHWIGFKEDSRLRFAYVIVFIFIFFVCIYVIVFR